ncbi:hypothetical protein HPB52_009933 [Rhipicephalus sanguineus]|uniref:Uncharacterized protein n=1 Tax=Rhipicephalus sanguineus TaxID=34632 RepID=A0A9D4Q624_RHISA|nr:hypothetical protein HPB52_009933 [Rhipicephalus sanguineus]
MNRRHRPLPSPTRHPSGSRQAKRAHAHPARHPGLPPSLGRRTVTTWTTHDSAGVPVGWVSRLTWELQPRPAIFDAPPAAPEPFRGIVLSNHYPTEPPTTYTAEEARILCPLSGVPKHYRRQHQNGAIHIFVSSVRTVGCRLPVRNTISSRVIYPYGDRLRSDLGNIWLLLPTPIGLFFAALKFLGFLPDDQNVHINKRLGTHVMERPLVPAEVVGIRCGSVAKARRLVCASPLTATPATARCFITPEMEEVRVNGWRVLIQLDSLGVTFRRVEDLLHPAVYGPNI